MSDSPLEYQHEFESRLEAAGASRQLTSGLFQFFHDGRSPEEADAEATRFAVVVLGAALPAVDEALVAVEASERAEQAQIAGNGNPEDVVGEVEFVGADLANGGDLFQEREELALATAAIMTDRDPTLEYLWWDGDGVHFKTGDGERATLPWAQLEGRVSES